MPFVVRDKNVRIWYNDACNGGFPVIFSHGFASSSDLWRLTTPAVESDGYYRPIIWDMRGHAKSDSPSDLGLYSKREQVDDLKAVLDACGVKQAIFVGHSMGGYDNLLFHFTYPEYVKAHVLYGTGPGFASDKGRLRWNKTAEKMAMKYVTKGLDALVGSDKTKGHRSAKGLINACRGNYAQRIDDPLFCDLASLGGPLSVARNLHKISVPCAIIVGERDRHFLRASEMMHSKLPSSTLDKVTGAGHMACEKNPNAFNTVLLKALHRFTTESSNLTSSATKTPLSRNNTSGHTIIENHSDSPFPPHRRLNNVLQQIAAPSLVLDRTNPSIHAKNNSGKISKTPIDTHNPPVLYEISDCGYIVSIILNRPANRNSMTPDVFKGLSDAITRVKNDPNVRCVILTGNGRSFCAGADFKSTTGAQVKLNAPPNERSYHMYKPFLSVLDIEVPVIGALNGHAIGGGLGLAIVCDLRIANTRSKYGASFVHLGLHPGMASTYILPRLCGLPNAMELLLTGRIVGGNEAARLGLVNYACDGSEAVLAKAWELAKEIANNAPIATRWTKKSIYQFLSYDPHPAAWWEANLQSRTLEMNDFKEGVAAMLGKRDPHFDGK